MEKDVLDMETIDQQDDVMYNPTVQPLETTQKKGYYPVEKIPQGVDLTWMNSPERQYDEKDWYERFSTAFKNTWADFVNNEQRKNATLGALKIINGKTKEEVEYGRQMTVDALDALERLEEGLPELSPEQMKTFAAQLGAGAGSMAEFVAISAPVAAMTGKIGEKIAEFVVTRDMVFKEGALQDIQKYIDETGDMNLENYKGSQKDALINEANADVQGLIEVIGDSVIPFLGRMPGINKLSKPIVRKMMETWFGRTLLRLGEGTGTNFLEEYTQTAPDNIAQILKDNEELSWKKIWEGAGEAGLIGAILGGGEAAVHSAAQYELGYRRTRNFIENKLAESAKERGIEVSADEIHNAATELTNAVESKGVQAISDNTQKILELTDPESSVAQKLTRAFEDLVNQGYVRLRGMTEDEVRQAGLDWANWMQALAILQSMERGIALSDHPLNNVIAELDRLYLSGRNPGEGDLIPLDINNAQVQHLAEQIDDYITKSRQTREEEQNARTEALREAELNARLEAVKELEQNAIAELEKARLEQNEEAIANLTLDLNMLTARVDSLTSELQGLITNRQQNTGRISIKQAKGLESPRKAPTQKTGDKYVSVDGKSTVKTETVKNRNGTEKEKITVTTPDGQSKQIFVSQQQDGSYLMWWTDDAEGKGQKQAYYDNDEWLSPDDAKKKFNKKLSGGQVDLSQMMESELGFTERNNLTADQVKQGLEKMGVRENDGGDSAAGGVLQFQDLPAELKEQFDLAEENARLDEMYPEYTGDTIEVDGKVRTVYNSEGQRINKSAEALTNFWRWFGDSKVVDEQGRPLVVYHGSKINNLEILDSSLGDSETYGSSAGGTYLTSNYSVAMTYMRDTNAKEIKEIPENNIVLLEYGPNYYEIDSKTGNFTGRVFNQDGWYSRQYKLSDETGTPDLSWYKEPRSLVVLNENLKSIAGINDYKFNGEDYIKQAKQLISDLDSKETGKIYSVYLKMKKPLVLDFGGESFNGDVYDGMENIIRAIKKKRLKGFDYSFEYELPIQALERYAKEHSYDGLIVKNVYDNADAKSLPSVENIGDDYVAFEPTQIKSVNNLGYYSSADDRLDYQIGYASMKGEMIGDYIDANKFGGTGEGPNIHGWGNYFLASREKDRENYLKKFERQGPALRYDGEELSGRALYRLGITYPETQSIIMNRLGDLSITKAWLTKTLRTYLRNSENHYTNKIDNVVKQFTMLGEHTEEEIRAIIKDIETIAKGKGYSVGVLFGFPKDTEEGKAQAKYLKNEDSKELFKSVYNTLVDEFGGEDRLSSAATMFERTIADLESQRKSLEAAKKLDFDKITGRTGLLYKGIQLKDYIEKYLDAPYMWRVKQDFYYAVRNAMALGKDPIKAIESLDFAQKQFDEKKLKADIEKKIAKKVDPKDKVLTSKIKGAFDAFLNSTDTGASMDSIMSGLGLSEGEKEIVNDITSDMEGHDYLFDENNSWNPSIANVFFSLREDKAMNETLKKAKELFKDAKKEDFEYKASASMYKTNKIPENNELLDEQKPLYKQPEEVKEALKQLYADTGMGIQPVVTYNVQLKEPLRDDSVAKKINTEGTTFSDWEVNTEYRVTADRFAEIWLSRSLYKAKEYVKEMRDGRNSEMQGAQRQADRYADMGEDADKIIWEGRVARARVHRDIMQYLLDKIEKIPVDASASDYADYSETFSGRTGKDYLSALEGEFRNELGTLKLEDVGAKSSADAAAKLLLKYGIRGIRYFGREDKRGFVTFEPTLAKERIYQHSIYDGLISTDSVPSVINDLQQLKDGSHERLLFDTRNGNWYLANADEIVHPDMFIKAFRQGNYPEFNNEREAEQYFQENYLSDNPTLFQFMAGKYDNPADAREAMEHTLGTDEYTYAYLSDGLVLYARGEDDLANSGFPVDGFDQYKVSYDNDGNRKITLEKPATTTLFQNKKTSASKTGLGKEYRGAYDPMTQSLIFSKISDVTTLFHESAHYWFDMNMRYYKTGMASPEWKDRWEKVMEELGVVPNARGYVTAASVKAGSEKFARSMEAYLKTGEYENAAMQWAHQDYKNMVGRVYRNLWKNYWGLEDLSPAVKDWFNMNGFDVSNPMTAFAEKTTMDTAEEDIGNIVATDETKPDVPPIVQEEAGAANGQVVENRKGEVAIVPEDQYETDKRAHSKLPESAEKATGVEMEPIMFNRRSMSDSLRAARDLVDRDPVRAWEALKAGDDMIDGLYAGDIYRALISKYKEENNPTMIKTVVQSFANAARRAGRSVKAFDLETPTVSFEGTISSLNKVFATKSNDAKVNELVKQIKNFLHDPEALNKGWEKFKEELECK